TVHDGLPAGHAARLAIKARDVSVALERPQGSSIVNVIPVRVLDMAPADNPDHILVRLDADGTALLARITRYSRDQLKLAPGMPAWALIKAVSVLGWAARAAAAAGVSGKQLPHVHPANDGRRGFD